jgi:hypothetical protein
VNFDRQIVASAKVHGAKVIYADDKTLINFAKRMGIAVSSWDLPAPRENQADLFEDAEPKARAVGFDEDV